jgi:chorismate dehydratase
MTIRLGVVSYLNTHPLVYALERNLIPHRFELIYDVPSACARLLATGEVDLAIVPSVEYARSRNFRVVPGVAIASDGPVRSVLLLSRRPLDQVRSVALDISSRTSVALARVLMRRLHGFAGEFIDHPPDLDAMLRAADAAVLIGDSALHVDRPDLHVWDLGHAWREMTGLPFVFAVWAGRPEALEPDDVATLIEAKRIGLRHVDDIAADFARGRRNFPSFYASYLTENIHYGLGSREIEGLKTFYRYASEIGLIECEPEIRFYDF